MNIAVVTGASNGMGREFARILDNEHLDEIWAIGRNVKNLEELKSQLQTPVRIFAVDLTNGGLEEIFSAFQEYAPNIRWLINAAGFGKFGRYDEIPIEESTNMIRLNCECLVSMTEHALPYMKEGAKIAQFSSLAAFQPTPFENVYAATKAFVYSYARALHYELEPRKISVCAVCPFWTESAFFSRAEFTEQQVIINKGVVYKAADVVQKAYKDMLKNKQVSIYGAYARNQARLVKLFPVKVVINTWMNQQKFRKRYK